MTAKEFVKRLTSVPNEFIDELFELYGMGTTQSDHVVRLDAVAKWLQARKDQLAVTVRRSYREGIDYVVSRAPPAHKRVARANHYRVYLLTPDCFKRLAMASRSKNAEMVRTYFIDIENQ